MALVNKYGQNSYGQDGVTYKGDPNGYYSNSIGVAMGTAPFQSSYPTVPTASTYSGSSLASNKPDTRIFNQPVANSGNYLSGQYSATNSATKAAQAAQAAKNAASASASASSKASGSSSGTNASGDGSYLAYLQLVQAQQAAEQRRADEAAAARREAAQNAYNRGMNYLNSAYSQKLNSLGNNFNSALGQLQDSYNNSANNVNTDADRSLRQAYINRMMNEKNLGQQMSAQGLSGGATESTLARLYNNYGNSRNNIETTRANNLNQLEQLLNSSQASALQSYNNALADAESERMQYAMNLENNLANNEISAADTYQNALSHNNTNYLNALSDAVRNMAAYNYDPTKATNDLNLATVIQAASNANSNYPQIGNSYGAVDNGVSTGTLANNSNNAYLQALLKSLYGIS